MRQRRASGFLPICLVVVLAGGTALGLAASQAGAGDNTDVIVVRGTRSMVPLIERWASSYSTATPGIGFDIKGGGSDEGVKELLQGQADIVAVSRPLRAEEHKASLKNGLALHETIVARMGIAVVVHPSNPVQAVPVQQVASVFAGEITSWKALGGPDQAIIVVRKETGWSPKYFQSRVMGGKQYLSGGQIVDSKKEILNQVAEHPWAIGITGMQEAMPALDRVTLLLLESDTSEADATYALSRPLYFYTAGSSPVVQSFIHFVSSPEGQQSIVDTGFFPAQQRDPLEE